VRKLSPGPGSLQHSMGRATGKPQETTSPGGDAAAGENSKAANSCIRQLSVAGLNPRVTIQRLKYLFLKELLCFLFVHRTACEIAVQEKIADEFLL
jgi:hypothetical protein